MSHESPESAGQPGQLTAKEIQQLVDDLRVARSDLNQSLNAVMHLADKITDLVVLLIRLIR